MVHRDTSTKEWKRELMQHFSCCCVVRCQASFALRVMQTQRRLMVARAVAESQPVVTAAARARRTAQRTGLVGLVRFTTTTTDVSLDVLLGEESCCDAGR